MKKIFICTFNLLLLFNFGFIRKINASDDVNEIEIINCLKSDKVKIDNDKDIIGLEQIDVAYYFKVKYGKEIN